MANALTTGSQISCAHQGIASTTSSAKLTVGGNPVLLANGFSAWAIGGCTQVGTGLTPCAKIAAISVGQATKLSVGGVAVLFDSLVGTTNGSPVNTLSATANQSKLSAT